VPAPSVTIKSLKIFPGDLVTASVVVNGNEILMQVKNRTRKTVFTKRMTVASPDLTSAEWIAEAPSECSSTGYCGQIPLANFGSVTFTKVAALATIAGLGDQGGTVASPLWQSTAIQLVPQGRERYFGDRFDRPDVTTGTAGATPFGLTSGGDSFGVNWVADSTTLG
jgi:Peptidase A4 family